MRLTLLLALLATIAGTEVHAQQIILPCVPSGPSCIPVSAANPLPTTGNTVTSVTIGTTTLTSGTDTRVLFQDGASPTGVLQENAGLTFTKGTGLLTSTLFNVTGAGSAAAPSLAVGNATTGFHSVSTTALGVDINGVLKLDYGITNGANWTFAASANVFVPSILLATSGVAATTTATGAFRVTGGMGVTGDIFAGATLNATLAAASGTSTVCNSAGASTALTLVVSGTACASSAMRFKDAYPPEALNLAGLEHLRTDQTWSYRKDSGTYENGRVHVGLFADDVEAMDPRCVVYDQEGKLLNYYDRCVLAYLVAARNADRAEFDAYKRSHP